MRNLLRRLRLCLTHRHNSSSWWVLLFNRRIGARFNSRSAELKSLRPTLLVLNAVHCEKLVDVRMFGKFQADYRAKIDNLTVIQEHHIIGDAAH